MSGELEIDRENRDGRDVGELEIDRENRDGRDVGEIEIDRENRDGRDVGGTRNRPRKQRRKRCGGN